MQSIIRFYLCKFNCSNTIEAQEKYTSNEALMIECVNHCKAQLLTTPVKDIVVSQTKYDTATRRYLSLVGYKGHIFCGLYNANDKMIHFEDTDCIFEKYDIDSQIAKLESIFISNCKRSVKEQGATIPEIQNAWKTTLPLLDKIIRYEHSLELISSDADLKKSLKHDEVLDQLISDYENNIQKQTNLTLGDEGILM